METRHVVFALIGVALLLVTLLVGILSGCLVGGLFCGLCGLTASGASGERYAPAPPIPTPRAPGHPTPTIIRDRVGALIVEVLPGTPAEAAGLRPGDMIVSVDRQSLVGDRTLGDVIGAYRPGDEVALTVLRNGRAQTIRVRLAAHPDDPGRAYLGVKATMLRGEGPRPPTGD